SLTNAFVRQPVTAPGREHKEKGLQPTGETPERKRPYDLAKLVCLMFEYTSPWHFIIQLFYRTHRDRMVHNAVQPIGRHRSVLLRKFDNWTEDYAHSFRLAEVLQQLKCPHSLEPHQIQGLDYIHIFPVVQKDIPLIP
uniref:Coiled-coil domain-containing protein 93 n=1 Tax=Parascaris equorum TaxID=6256 RepID=A0A914RRG0_PAREQ